MNGKALRDLRIHAGLPGYLICQRSGLGRSRLSDIERGYVEPSNSETERIKDAIKNLVEAKERVNRVAVKVGWPM